jgi:hypothetical protein
MQFVCENLRADDLMKFDLLDSADKCLRRTCWFAVKGGIKFVMELSPFGRYRLYG